MAESTQDRNEPDAADSPPLVVITDTAVDPHIVMHHEPRALQAEQYRAFRTNLLAMGRNKGSRSVVLTSGVKGDGKSVSAVNIAICLAEAPGTRVCLIDADFRSPRVADLLGLGGGKGLSELLLDEATLADVLVETRVQNLFVIRSGRPPRNPSELLASERVKNLLDTLKQQFTHILCDTPPVNPFTDAAVLGARTDGVVLVVRMNSTGREQAERARHVLERAGAHVNGAFLTDTAAQDPDAAADYEDEADE